MSTPFGFVTLWRNKQETLSFPSRYISPCSYHFFFPLLLQAWAGHSSPAFCSYSGVLAANFATLCFLRIPCFTGCRVPPGSLLLKGFLLWRREEKEEKEDLCPGLESWMAILEWKEVVVQVSSRQPWGCYFLCREHILGGSLCFLVAKTPAIKSCFGQEFSTRSWQQ